MNWTCLSYFFVKIRIFWSSQLIRILGFFKCLLRVWIEDPELQDPSQIFGDSLQWAISELPQPSFSKGGFCAHLFTCKINFHSHENEFNLRVNENWFAHERLSTKTRFEKEAWGNSEMAYFSAVSKNFSLMYFSFVMFSIWECSYRYANTSGLIKLAESSFCKRRNSLHNGVYVFVLLFIRLNFFKGLL